MDCQLIDNSDGVTVNGGGGKSGGGKSGGSARRSAAGQRSSVESRFGEGRGANVARNQAILRDRNSTPEQRAAAKRKIGINTTLATRGTVAGSAQSVTTSGSAARR